MSLKKMSDFDVRSNVCINAQYTSKNISSYQVDVFAGCEKPYLVTDALEAKMSLIIDVLQDLAKMLKKTGNGD